jgi:hypothetical protein
MAGPDLDFDQSPAMGKDMKSEVKHVIGGSSLTLAGGGGCCLLGWGLNIHGSVEEGRGRGRTNERDTTEPRRGKKSIDLDDDAIGAVVDRAGGG